MPDQKQIDGGSSSKANTVRDPVCGMSVAPEKACGSAEHAGKTYFFCSPRCLERFNTEPAKYVTPPGPVALKKVPVSGTAANVSYVCPMDPDVREHKPGPCPKCGMALEPEAVEYTCPMHPEIVRNAPGNCPICGMALEPRIAAHQGEEDDSELRSMQRRFWVGVALSIPLLALSMGGMAEGSPLRNLPMGWLEWLQLVLATPAVVWGGWPFFQRGWASLVNRSLNMFTLIAMGTGTAYVYSVIATIAPGIFPASFRGPGGRPDVYFEVSAIIVTLVLLGQVLELRARRHTSGAIRALLDLRPKTARRGQPCGSDVESAL